MQTQSMAKAERTTGAPTHSIHAPPATQSSRDSWTASAVVAMTSSPVRARQSASRVQSAAGGSSLRGESGADEEKSTSGSSGRASGTKAFSSCIPTSVGDVY